MIGQRVGSYEILARLGAGGMGVVYRARDQRLGRLVALKFLPPHFADEEMRRRFLLEAQAISAFDHPAICTVYEIGETADGHPFLAMAHYEGETLRERLRRGPLHPDEALRLLLQAAEGLEVAHAAGVVHRDVKPANLFVTTAGMLKILDFGLAHRAGATRVTRTGAVVGTVAYMAPEQIQGAAVDARADVWSLGVVLYEALTGRPAFAGDSDAATLHAILTSEPPPASRFEAALPPEADRVLGELLAKDPGRRTPDMAAVAAALRRLAGISEPAAGARSAYAASALAHGRTVVLPAAAASGAAAPPPAALGDRSLAILAFANLSRDPAVDWLAAGIAESIAGDLRRIAGLEVAAREPNTGATGGVLEPAAAMDAAARAGARWAVWGSYQKAGEALRILVHVADAAERSVREPIKVDGPLADVFALQDHIVGEVAGVLDVALSESARLQLAAPQTELVEAYEHCARGMQMVFRMDRASFGEAAACFRRALELDPGYAMAHSGLGQVRAMTFIGTGDRADLEAAVEHLERAVDLDPELGDPYLWLTYSHARLGRYEDAATAGRRAVALEPRSSLAHYFLAVAWWLRAILEGASLEQWSEALEHAQRAVELAPRNQSALMLLADLYLRCGQYEAALPFAARAAEVERSGDYEAARFVGGQVCLGIVQARLQRGGEAWATLAAAQEHLTATEHVYTPALRSYCRYQQAALLFRRLDYSSALPLLRLARAEIAEKPHALAVGWFLARLELMAARVFHRVSMAREEAAALAAARELLERREGHDFSGVWGGGTGELLFDLADYYALVQQRELALDTLERAVAAGWRERPLLRLAAGFAALQGEPRLAEIERQVETLPPLPEPPISGSRAVAR